ncbi:Na-K-Cl cotransporter [Candidatus Woesearchaeota archaeon]|nr:Na-K-Cl cotransporter [Candidatus Woesearchaeota archaeon]
MAEKKTGSRSFGAFRGVFVPTFLTIIGVILYLRLGRIVGEAGIAGAIAIVLLAVSITICTGLSLSSITTTIRIGAGGAFSIISKTLGLEIGGSIGIPLFIAQVFSVVLYIFGFTEAWRFIFPSHPRIIVLSAVFIMLFALTFMSLKYAIKAQIVVFGLVLLSLVSIFAGGGWWNHALTIPVIGSFRIEGFWVLFALFFPAVTGLMAGVGMSGELSDPKRQIPKGVISALGVTTVIYIIMIFWFGYSASPEQLINNNLAVVDIAASGVVVLIGILAATFSSALTTLVAAPRLLQALSENQVFFFNSFFSKKSSSGDPRNATLFSGIIIAVSLALGNLDSIAPVLTMVFLITYAMINLVVFIEQSMGFVSFRPTFRIPHIVPIYGALGSIIIMFYINIIAGMIALAMLLGVYLLLVRRKLEVKEGYVRSGLLLAVSEWAAKKVMSLAESKKQVWKPNILFPVRFSRTLLGNFPLVKAIIFPHGGLSVLGIKIKKGKRKRKENKDENEVLPSIVDKFGKEGIFTSYAHINAKDYINGVTISMQAIEGQFFHPNILFLPMAPEDLSKKEEKRIFRTVKDSKAGLIIYDKDPEIGLGSQEDIHVWIPDDVLDRDFYEERRFDLAMLVAYRLRKNWVGSINLWMNTTKDREDEAKRYLRRLVYEARFPPATEKNVFVGTLLQAIRKAPKGDVHIISVTDQKDFEEKAKKMKNVRRSVLYVMDSGQEDVMA